MDLHPFRLINPGEGGKKLDIKTRDLSLTAIFAALYALLLNEIEEALLFICHDYKTDKKGSMIIDEEDFNSTGNIIWDEKEKYYNMWDKFYEKYEKHSVPLPPDMQ